MTDTEFVQKVALPCVELLDQTTQEIATSIPPPTTIHDPVYPRYRYHTLTPSHFCLLRAVRVVSALESCILLWNSGHVQEVGVIGRTIIDFLHDIVFILEEQPSGGLSPIQEKLLNEWAKEPLINPAIPFEGTTIRTEVSRQKINAGVARVINVINPHDQQKMLEILEKTYSGYVHANYAQVMEMYGGNPPHFHTRGMQNTPRISEWRGFLTTQLHHALSVFTFMSYRLGLAVKAQILLSARQGFEQAMERTFNLTPQQMLNKIKKSREQSSTDT